MTTCRCTAIKYATTELRSLDQRVLEEIGLGKPSNIGALDLLIDGYRTLFQLRKGLPLSGILDPREMHQRFLTGKMPYEDFEVLSTAEAALLLFRARRG